MDTASYEEVAVSATVMGDVYQWIAEGTECKLVSFKGSVIEVIPPSPAVFTVVETEPNMKGNTSQGYTKPAVLDCGATISVPGFVEPGQKIRVDTEKGVYMERVN
jgi:elongation factor P